MAWMKRAYWFRAVIILCGIIAGAPAAPAAMAAGGDRPFEGPKVAVSIRPIHSLVAGVMRGVAKPILLMKWGHGDPHSLGSSLSLIRHRDNLDLVVWVGRDMERDLANSIISLPRRVKRLQLMDLVGVRLLPFRPNPLHSSTAPNSAPITFGLHDPHIWLAPDNAMAMVAAIANQLSRLDPGNKSRYRTNAARLRTRLFTLDARLRTELADVSSQPFLTVHDGFQYFDHAYQLNWTGAIANAMDHEVGTRAVNAARRQIVAGRTACLALGPTAPVGMAGALLNGTSVEYAALDPMGHNFRPGPQLYFNMMTANAENLGHCLRASR